MKAMVVSGKLDEIMDGPAIVRAFKMAGGQDINFFAEAHGKIDGTTVEMFYRHEKTFAQYMLNYPQAVKGVMTDGTHFPEYGKTIPLRFHREFYDFEAAVKALGYSVRDEIFEVAIVLEDIVDPVSAVEKIKRDKQSIQKLFDLLSTLVLQKTTE